MTHTVHHQVTAELKRARQALADPFKVEGLDWDTLNLDLDVINLIEATLEKLQYAPPEETKELKR